MWVVRKGAIRARSIVPLNVRRLACFVLWLSKCREGSMAHVGKHAIVVGAGMGGL